MRVNAFRLTVFALCLLFALAAAAQEPAAVVDDRWQNGVTEAWWFNSHRYTPEQAAAARAVWERIGDAGGDAWAGDYIINMDTRAHYLRWSPKGLVSFNVNTCTANVDSLDYAETVSESPGEVVVDSATHPRTYVKVKWGERRYLVDQHAVGAFCDYVAGLGEYNAPNNSGEVEFLMHGEDGAKPTAPLPTVPPEYQEHVRKPINARVVRVGKAYVEVNPEDEWYDDLVTPIRVSAGSDRGLRRGMKLHALDSDDYDERVELTRVGRDYALGIVVRAVRKRPGVKMGEWDDGNDEPGTPVAVGWRLTTSLHKRLLHREELMRDAEEAEQK
ncbi:MAG TPA: hypothetical protein VF297_10035 [Pyrinomonadaceae bacterium]